jgi:AraC-like DNA-binding protein
MARTSVYLGGEGARFHADTCEPLRAAMEAGRIRLHALARGTYPGASLPTSWLPGLRSVGYWDAPEPQGWGLDWHRNEGVELTYVSAGHVGFATRDHHRLLEPGALTITRPWQRHRVGDPNVHACRLHWLIIDVGVRRPNQAWRWPRWIVADRDELEQLTRLLRENEEPVWQADSEVVRTFERLSRLVANPETATAGRIATLINELLLALVEMLMRQRPELDQRLATSERAVRLFLETLQENPGERWSLDSMAAACGIGRTAFAHYCQRYTNLTPKQYLTQCRLREAARLLAQQPSVTITEVASSCGFATSQHFATRFRRWAGVTPREYRDGATASELIPA